MGNWLVHTKYVCGNSFGLESLDTLKIYWQNIYFQFSRLEKVLT